MLLAHTSTHPANSAACLGLGAEAEFEQLFRQYRDGLQSFLMRNLRNREDAEDVLMQTFLKAWRNRESFRGVVSEKQWLYGIASRVAIDLYRSRSRRPVERVDDLGDVEPKALNGEGPRNPADLVLETERRHEIREVVSRLAPDQRQLVELHYFDGYRYDEISALLGIPTTKVRGRLHRIRKLIHHELAPMAS